MSNSQTSLLMTSEKANKKVSVISQIMSKASTLDQINFKFHSIFSKQISENSIEVQKINSNRAELLSKIEQINSKISSLEEDRYKYNENFKKTKSKLENELEMLTKSKDSEISSIKDEISYKADLSLFFETLSSISVNDKQDAMQIQITLFGDSIIFKLHRNDEDKTFHFELISCSISENQLPEWIKTHFTIEYHTCSKMISHIYEGLLNKFS